MFRSIALGLVAGTLSATAAFAQQPPATPAQQPAPAQQAAAAPAARTFASDAGMVLNFIKPDKTSDFEAVIDKLKEALAKSEKPERKQQAASWKVFKSPDPAAGGNVLYVFMIDPSVKGADYTVSTILAEAFPQEVQALYKQYAEAYASGQNFVNLALVKDLGK
jgi:pyruvate/2-oxoglutarate dehydrogenase complex dihydrolipoamide acyltransferase (E2) component